MNRQRGFTLIELLTVLAIIAIAMTLFGLKLGTFSYWREEGFVRKLSETLIFLHHQAVVDQSFYRIDFDFEKNQYRIGALVTEGADQNDSNLALLASGEGVGNLSLELAAFLSPAIGTSQSLVPPASFPSLAEPVPLPDECEFEDIRTMRGLTKGNQGEGAYLLFSPRGFSEFGVIHLRLKGGRPVTILVNPFTGLTEIYREYKDFEWSYGQSKSDK